jgi:hypothetical protein
MTLALSNLRVGPNGIGFALHPTRAPIVVLARSAAPLEVCPADPLGRPSNPRVSSFGRRFTRCLRLPDGDPLALPGTDGRSHVGIRISTLNRRATTIQTLRLGWDCTDDYFVTNPRSRALERAVRCPTDTPAESR